MNLINGYYTDSNNNKWDSKFFTEQQADSCSNSLSECYNCINCRDSQNIRDCINCIACFTCTECVDSRNLSDCNNCSNCSQCVHCDNLSDKHKYLNNKPSNI